MNRFIIIWGSIIIVQAQTLNTFLLKFGNTHISYSCFIGNIPFKDSVKREKYCIEKISDPMIIDADWKKPQWKPTKAVELNYYMGKLPKYKSLVKAKMRYDSANIYVIFKVIDHYVRSNIKQINGPVWQDNTVEFFFAPDTTFPLKYFNLEINCAGVPLMHYNAKANTNIQIVDTADIKQIEIAHSYLPTEIEEVVGPITWILEYKIPIAILKKYSSVTMPAKGVTWKMNLYKIAHKSSNPHYISWSFVGVKDVDMHTPHFFGDLEFQ